MSQSLLICIAFHYSPDRLKYLVEVLRNILENYKVPLQIIIDTNVDYLDLSEKFDGSPITIVPHTELKHPFHLTWCHRKHIKENIDNYDVFAYFEDDILVPFENYIAYIQKLKMMWPKFVPSFIRIEKKDHNLYLTDIPDYQKIKESEIIHIEGRHFVSLPFPINYNGFFIIPQVALKETLKDNFVRMDEGREFAASYTNWDIGRKPLLEIFTRDATSNKYLVNPSCYSYHLPNNYANSPESKYGKIKVEEMFNDISREVYTAS